MAGLGRAGRIMLSWFRQVEGVELAAVADPRADALEPFQEQGVHTFLDAVDMCKSSDVDAICIATPSELHWETAVMAARNGKHILAEKPMALSLEEAAQIVDAVHASGVKYVQRSKTFDPPIRKMRQVVASGQLGPLIQVNSWNYRGWLVNWSFLASELDTTRGGGLTMRQGPHQVDIIRAIGGGMVKSIRARTGRWSPDFDTEGNYSAYLEFEDGTPAMLSNNGYGYFDTAELTWGYGEAGNYPLEELYTPRARAARPLDPGEKYGSREYQGIGWAPPALQADRPQPQRNHQPFYGLTVVSCQRGDMRQSPEGLFLYTKGGKTEIPCDVDGPANELVELRDAVVQERPAFPDERWGMASLEVLLAIRQSSDAGRELVLKHQIPYQLPKYPK
jgi:phthalate 4,5-cis-dihydrodiol dehydrogenase